MIGIYGIFRKSDDKCMYVGQSKNVNERIKQHLSGKSPNKFNSEEHYGEMIEEHMLDYKQFRLEREAYWINELNPEFNKIRDRHHSKETTIQMSENNGMKGKHPDHRGNKNPMYGKHFSEETIKKQSKVKLGKNNPVYDRRWINNGVITKMIKSDELHQYLENGWKLGRITTIKLS